MLYFFNPEINGYKQYQVDHRVADSIDYVDMAEEGNHLLSIEWKFISKWSSREGQNNGCGNYAEYGFHHLVLLKAQGTQKEWQNAADKVIDIEERISQFLHYSHH